MFHRQCVGMRLSDCRSQLACIVLLVAVQLGWCSEYYVSPDGTEEPHPPVVLGGDNLQFVECPSEIMLDYLLNPRKKVAQSMNEAVARRCGKYHYRNIVMPNFVGQNNQSDALAVFGKYNALVQSECHPELEFFLCLLHFPVYTDVGPQPQEKIPTAPTRALCNRVRSACESYLNHVEFPWPRHMMCHRLPNDHEFCDDMTFYPSLNSSSDLVEAGFEVQESSTPEPNPPITTEEQTQQRDWEQGPGHSAMVGRVEQAVKTQVSAWERVTGNNEAVRDSGRRAYANASCFLSRHDKVPPAERDVLTVLGHPHNMTCCVQCALHLRAQVREMNTLGNTTLWSWAFMGSVISANATVTGGKRHFVLKARVDHVPAAGPKLNHTGPYIYIHVDGGNVGDCVCSRPDSVTTNLFMGSFSHRPGSNEPIFHLDRMGAIWPQRVNNHPLPKAYRKWRKFVHRQAKEEAAARERSQESAPTSAAMEPSSSDHGMYTGN
eukprot:scpid70827/ scgid26347/ Frizzled-1